MPRNRPLVATVEARIILEGGGAKGIAHLGVVKAIEERPEYDIKGLAGTSAGAFVAALCAAGYKSNDILEFPARDSDATRRQMSVLDMLGDAKRRQLHFYFGINRLIFRRLFSSHDRVNLKQFGLWALLAVVLLISVADFVLYNLVEVSFFDRAGREGVIFATSATVVRFLFWLALLYVVYLGICGFRGVFSAQRLSDSINEALAKQLRSDPSRRVLFRQLPRQLKIVVSDIQGRKLAIFSTGSTPDAPVAEAVVASMAIPLLFRPHYVDATPYLDGGLVANLPGWIFRPEQHSNRDSATIISAIEHRATDREARQWFISDLLKTVAFGARNADLWGHDRLIVMSSRPNIGVLDVADLSRMNAAYEDSHNYAKRAIEIELKRVFETQLLRRFVRRCLARLGHPRTEVRASLVERITLTSDAPHFSKLSICSGYEIGDLEPYAVFRSRGSILATSWERYQLSENSRRGGGDSDVEIDSISVATTLVDGVSADFHGQDFFEALPHLKHLQDASNHVHVAACALVNRKATYGDEREAPPAFLLDVRLPNELPPEGAGAVVELVQQSFETFLRHRRRRRAFRPFFDYQTIKRPPLGVGAARSAVAHSLGGGGR